MTKSKTVFIGCLCVVILISACSSQTENPTSMSHTEIGASDRNPTETLQAMLTKPIPYPKYVGATYPPPSAVASLSSPNGWGDEAGYYALIYGSPIGTICIKILEEPLLRPGDDWLHFDNAQITLDSQLVTVEPQHSAELEQEIVRFEGGGTASGVYSDTLCWKTDVGTGIHLVDLLVWTSTNEQFQYSWAFEVTQ